MVGTDPRSRSGIAPCGGPEALIWREGMEQWLPLAQASAQGGLEMGWSFSRWPGGPDWVSIVRMEWYYGENGQRMGPISEADLGSLIAAGRVGAATLIWREGMAQWTPLGVVSAQGGLAVLPPSTGYDLLRPATTSGLAIASMVCGIVGISLTCFGLGILGIPAVICGHMAMHQIANSRNMVVGRGMALTGLICGYLSVLIFLCFAGMMIFAMVKAP